MCEKNPLSYTSLRGNRLLPVSFSVSFKRACRSGTLLKASSFGANTVNVVSAIFKFLFSDILHNVSSLPLCIALCGNRLRFSEHDIAFWLISTKRKYLQNSLRYSSFSYFRLPFQ